MHGAWFTPKEIAKMDRMPRTIQGVHKKAKREGWRSRRKADTQGPGVEYFLSYHGIDPQVKEMRSIYHSHLQVTEKELQGVWLTIFYQLSPQERAILLSNVVKYGVNHWIQYQFVKRMQTISQVLTTLTPNEQEAILNFIETKLLITDRKGPFTDKLEAEPAQRQVNNDEEQHK